MNRIISYILFLMICFLLSGATLKPYNKKKANCVRILDELAQVWNLDQAQIPEIMWDDDTVNYTIPIKIYGGKIVVYETFYDLCEEMGEDMEAALAVMLGHELEHILKHDNIHFKAEKKSLSKAEEEKENAADIMGVFTSYLAGKNVIDVFPKVLDEIYKKYHIASKQKEYPTLMHRKSVAKDINNQIKNMIIEFETANHLTAIGEHALAIQFYECLIDQYPSYEMYNNLGVAQTLAARQLKPEEMAYALPLTLDLTSKLYYKKRDIMGFDATRYTPLLESAKENFDIAISKKDNYHLAKVNRACVTLLLDKENFTFEGIKTSPEYYILSGILNIEINNNRKATENARKYWSKIKEDSRYKGIAEYNLKILDNNGKALPKTKSAVSAKHIPKVNDQDFEKLLLCKADKGIYIHEKKGSLISGIKISKALSLYLYSEENQLEDLKEKYPNAEEIVTSNGIYLIVHKKGLFYLTKKNRSLIKGEYNRS